MSRYGSDDDKPLGEQLFEIIGKGLVVALIAVMSRCETKTNRARKPELAEDLVDHAQGICLVVDTPKPEIDYYGRLRTVLNNTFSNSMDVIKQFNIAVCPDIRLSKQNNGFFDKGIIGMYYPRDRVVSIYDNGNSVGKFWTSSATDHGNEVVEKLAERLQDGTASTDQPMFAARYSYRCGRRCTRTVTEWRSINNFDRDTIAKNPELFVPPIQGAHDWAPAR